VDISLKTDRLILKLPDESDAEAMFNAANDPEVRAGLISWPESVEDAQKLIRLFDCYAEVGTHYIFSMYIKESGEFIGEAGLNRIDREDRKAQIAYWCARKFWGMGYATEAVAGLIRYGFRTHDLNRISCGCFDFNIASERVMQKLGMTYELTVRHEFLKDGKFIDVRHYAILRSEWEKMQI
jgi:[ribosomal protein S5]-alanine N-acetyltransferase